mmetsp:Transcript_26963/g.86629  ORF Transcript_26963/g.86629 Transcript_26963/m.86629 type:complete len:433 (+) Transcript_26963:653-1951(+)
MDDVTTFGTLGRGASSVVMKGVDLRTNRFVALKNISMLDKEKRGQLMKEIRILMDAEPCEGLVTFFGAFFRPVDSQISVVLEYMDGGSLADILPKVGKFPEHVLSRVTAGCLEGLMQLHRRKMVHRDIKPANILMNMLGEAKVTDFGISAMVDSTLAECNTFTGTVTYMSPERIDSAPYSFPADIWSLGLTLLECSTGAYPYNANGGPLQLMIQVVDEESPLPPAETSSPEFRDFIALCLRKDQATRPGAAELLQHPFITKSTATKADMAGFMQKVYGAHTVMQDRAEVFASHFYKTVDGAAERVQQLASLYSDDSTFTMHVPGVSETGETVRGREAVMGVILRSRGPMNKLFGTAEHVVGHIDCQPLLGADLSAAQAEGETVMLLQVSGTLKLFAANGALAEAHPFAESFVLSFSAKGEYRVKNQVLHGLR